MIRNYKIILLILAIFKNGFPVNCSTTSNDGTIMRIKNWTECARKGHGLFSIYYFSICLG
jgi:hypothetical protein